MKKQFILLTIMCCFSVIKLYAQSIKKEETHKSSKDIIIDYYNDDFRPFDKGKWHTKLSLSLSDKQLDNVSRLFEHVENGDDVDWNVQLSAGHFLGDYFMVGAGIGYDEKKFTGNVINFDSELVNRNTISRNITVAPFVRIMVPLTDNHRLSLYNDFGLLVGAGRSLSRETSNFDEIESKYTKQLQLGLGISPGITYFMMHNFAFEAGVNLLGYRLNLSKSTDEMGIQSTRLEHDINFKTNLWTLNFGLSYYF